MVKSLKILENLPPESRDDEQFINLSYAHAPRYISHRHHLFVCDEYFNRFRVELGKAMAKRAGGWYVVCPFTIVVQRLLVIKGS
jgi:hypothetical protein